MPEQLSLLDFKAPQTKTVSVESKYPYQPARGKTDTSAEAADKVAKNHRKHHLIVLEWLARKGKLVADDVSKFSSIHYSIIRPRFSELKDLGMVALIPKDRNKNGDIIFERDYSPITKNSQLRWCITEKGKQCLEENRNAKS